MAKKSVLKAPLKYAPKSVEAAAYSDGHAVVTGKGEEGGSVKPDSDVKSLVAPVLAMQETVNRINRAGGQPQEEGAILVNAGEAVRTAAPPPSSSGSAVRSATPPATTGNGSAQGRGVLFRRMKRTALKGAWSFPLFAKDRA
jgi:hypothetical protein